MVFAPVTSGVRKPSMLGSLKLFGWLYSLSIFIALYQLRVAPLPVLLMVAPTFALFQYVRYLQFREKLNGVASGQDIQGALAFLSEQIQSNSVPPVSSHPVITFLFAAIFAILGSAAGHWPAKYTVASLLILLVLLYFSYMILGVVNTTQSDLKEFKRFLLWARDERPEA